MSRVYMYVVDRDFGFAPNPFHGFCTLATCKPGIRRGAEVGDWVIGMGGRRLNAIGRCIFAMRVTGTTSYNEYWTNPAYLDKKPVRNGSSKMMVGDNIYNYDPAREEWCQADSHHSHPDGTANMANVLTDTKANKVLISTQFFYFGKEAPDIPSPLLVEIGYSNCRNYRVFDAGLCSNLLNWLNKNHTRSVNQVGGDPFDFDDSEKRYSAGNNKIL